MAFDQLKAVDWLATAKLSLIRSVCSAIVLTIGGLLLGAFQHSTGSVLGGAFSFFLTWILAASVGATFYIWILKGLGATLGRIVPVAGLVTNLMQFLVIIMVAIGDPLTYAINIRFPQLLGIADFKVFNFVAIIFVQKASSREDDLAQRLRDI